MRTQQRRTVTNYQAELLTLLYQCLSYKGPAKTLNQDFHRQGSPVVIVEPQWEKGARGVLQHVGAYLTIAGLLASRKGP